MPSKRLSDRERRRLQTRRMNHGPDFDSRNARHAALQSQTKFTSGQGGTGSEAAKIRWKRYRAEKLKKIREASNGSN